MDAYLDQPARGRSSVASVAVVVAVVLVLDVVALAVLPAGRVTSRQVQSRVLAATTRTEQRRTARVEMRATNHLAGGVTGDTTVASTADGVADFTARSLAMQLHQNSGRVTTELRVVNGVYYMQFPPQLRTELHLTTPWVAFDLSKLVKSGNAAVMVNATGTIHDTLALLEQASSGVITGATETGHERVRGVPTSRYELTIDVAKLRAKLRELAVNPLVAGLDLSSFNIDQYSITVWIDHQGDLRRQRIHQHGTIKPQPGGPGTVTTDQSSTTEYYDFGVPVSIAAPPSTAVTILSSFSQLGRP